MIIREIKELITQKIGLLRNDKNTPLCRKNLSQKINNLWAFDAS